MDQKSQKSSTNLNGLGDKSKSPDDFVGFSNLPNQIYRRSVRRGFEFNIMVIGESGLGKSTFVNSLFLSDIYNSECPGPSRRLKNVTCVEHNSFIIKENGVRLKLTIVDAPGFGDSIDNSKCWSPVLEYLDNRFDDYMALDGKVSRSSDCIFDDRVHACIYFLAPTGHYLKALDLECLKMIHEKVNIIPVIGKADTLTSDECQEFKQSIMNAIKQNVIKIYDFSAQNDLTTLNGGLVEEEIHRNQEMRSRIPFAVVGANSVITTASGQKVRARSYPWGCVEVDNLDHNDFPALRHLLLSVHMQDLLETTHFKHYEIYRFNKLSGIAQMSHFVTRDGKDPMLLMEAEKREHEAKMLKMETEMEAVFEQKVREKTTKLKEFEADLLRRAEFMREQLHTQETELTAARQAFELERANWLEAWKDFDDLGSSGEYLSGSSAATSNASLFHSGGTGVLGAPSSQVMGLGDRVLSEVIKERTKTEKKRKGLF